MVIHLLQLLTCLRVSLFSGLVTHGFWERGLSLRYAFDELLKFENVQLSKLTVHCDELPPQDSTLAVCLVHLAFSPSFNVGILF